MESIFNKLPLDIVNKILTFRPIHPLAILIKKMRIRIKTGYFMDMRVKKLQLKNNQLYEHRQYLCKIDSNNSNYINIRSSLFHKKNLGNLKRRLHDILQQNDMVHSSSTRYYFKDGICYSKAKIIINNIEYESNTRLFFSDEELVL
jgi:hypothetical protein